MTSISKLAENTPAEDVKCVMKEENVEIDLQDKVVDENGTAEDEPLVAKEPEYVGKNNVHMQDYEEGMVYLYQTNRSPLLPSVDPNCSRLETWLRIAEVKYENVNHGMKFKSKKGQLPFIELDGEEYSGISSIIKKLSTRFNVNLDKKLSVQQQGVTSFAVAMLENHFSWILKAWRSKNPEDMLKAYQIDLQNITGKTWPKVILNFIYKCQQKKLAQAVVAHGIGVYTPKEIESFGRDDLQVLSDFLGEQEYLFGESPSSLDVAAFAYLSQLVYMDSEVNYALRDWINEKCSNLVVLCDRIKDRAFPDWEELLAVKDKELETKTETESKDVSKIKDVAETNDVTETKEKADKKKIEKEEMANKKKIEKEEKTDKKKIEKEEKADKKKVEKEEKKKEPTNKKDKKNTTMGEETTKDDDKKDKDTAKNEVNKDKKEKEDEDKEEDTANNRDKKEKEEKEGEDKKVEENEVDNKEQTNRDNEKDKEKKEDVSDGEEKKDEEKPVNNKDVEESVISQYNTEL